jgi:hypothetical protein
MGITKELDIEFFLSYDIVRENYLEFMKSVNDKCLFMHFQLNDTYFMQDMADLNRLLFNYFSSINNFFSFIKKFKIIDAVKLEEYLDNKSKKDFIFSLINLLRTLSIKNHTFFINKIMTKTSTTKHLNIEIKITLKIEIIDKYFDTDIIKKIKDECLIDMVIVYNKELSNIFKLIENGEFNR